MSGTGAGGRPAAPGGPRLGRSARQRVHGWTGRFALRLLAAVLVPVLALVAVCVRDVTSLYARANQASSVDAQVHFIDTTVSLDRALMTEKTDSEALSMARSFGLSAAQASRMLGLDIVASLEAARRVFASAAARGAAAPIGGQLGRLDALRAEVDAGRATVGEIAPFFDSVQATVENAWLGEARSLTQEATTMAFGRVRQFSQSLLDASRALVAGSEETTTIAQALLPSLPGGSHAREQLAEEAARYSQASSDMGAEFGPQGRAAWHLAQSDPQVATFDRVVSQLVGDQPQQANPPSLASLATVFRSGLDRLSRLVQVVSGATDDVDRVARSQRQGSWQDLEWNLLMLAAIALASGLVALAMTRSVNRPLRRLAARATEASRGDLTGEPLPVEGPREVALVAEALNATVANLRTVQAQALALASGTFDDPVLGHVVQGQLGESVRTSLHRLMRSVRDNDRLRRRLEHSERRFRALVQHADDLIVIVARDGTISYVSPSVQTVLGYTPDDITGTRAGHLLQPPAARHFDAWLAALGDDRGESLPFQVEIRDGSGSWRHVEGTATPMFGEPDIAGLVLNARDVSARVAAQQAIAHQATHDALTGLPNRTLLLDRLEHAIARNERTDGTVAVVFIDLDHFKVVNDARGHGSGDRLLVEVADRIRRAVRPGDTVARFGGDEFVAVLEGVTGAADASALCDRIQTALERPVVLDGSSFTVSASQGIALMSPGDDAQELLRAADAAMYSAKRMGRSRRAVADETIRTRALQRLDTEAQLRQALERREFVVHYQPIVSLSGGRIEGAEALVRWRHPERGIVAPSEFIHVAEETGLIVPLGDWVLGQALRDAASWGPDGPFVSVNLSGLQLVDGLPAVVEQALVNADVQPDRLRLEVTESILMQDVKRSAGLLEAIRGLGVGVSIDDFGTGYSSLSYLQKLPIDTLKIDKSFIDLLDGTVRDSTIVTAVVNLGRALGIGVLAEGLESAAQATELRRLGCDQAQGFFFSPPLPAHDFDELLAATRHATVGVPS